LRWEEAQSKNATLARHHLCNGNSSRNCNWRELCSYAALYTSVL